MSKDPTNVAGIVAAAALGGLGRFGRYATQLRCRLCGHAIVTGEGYRQVPGGHVHGACVKAQEAAQAGPPEAAQEDRPGGGDGVCPEG